MKNKILMLSGLLVLGACAPENLARFNGTAPEMSNGNFEYIGCHIVGAEGDEKWTMGLPGLSVKTTFNRIYFKQRNSDGSSVKVKATPCKDKL